MSTLTSGADLPPGGGGGPRKYTPTDKYSPPVLRSRRQKRSRTSSDGEDDGYRPYETQKESRDRRARYQEAKKRKSHEDGIDMQVSSAELERQQQNLASKASQHPMNLRHTRSLSGKKTSNPYHAESMRVLHRTLQSAGVVSKVSKNRADRHANVSVPAQVADSLLRHMSPRTRCLQCAGLHQRCDTGTPCQRCRRRRVACVRPNPIDPSLQTESQGRAQQLPPERQTIQGDNPQNSVGNLLFPPEFQAPGKESSRHEQQEYSLQGESAQSARPSRLPSGNTMVLVDKTCSVPAPHSPLARTLDEGHRRLSRMYGRLKDERESDGNPEPNVAKEQLAFEALIDPALLYHSTNSGNINFRTLPPQRIARPQTRPPSWQQPPADSYGRFEIPIFQDFPQLAKGERASKPLPTPESVHGTCDEIRGSQWNKQRCGNRLECRRCQNRAHDDNAPHWVCKYCDEEMKEAFGTGQRFYENFLRLGIRTWLCNKCALLFQGKNDRGVAYLECACQSMLQNYRYCKPHYDELPALLKSRAKIISDGLARNSSLGFDGTKGCPFCDTHNEDWQNNVNFSGNGELCMGCDEIITITQVAS